MSKIRAITFSPAARTRGHAPIPTETLESSATPPPPARRLRSIPTPSGRRSRHAARGSR